MLLRFWHFYNSSLVARPLLTKCMTSCTGFILGDSIAQLLKRDSGKFDYGRTLRFATFGFFLHAPSCHFFYNILDSCVFPNSPKSAKAVVIKMGIDQLIWSPIATCTFYAATKILEGKPQEIKQTIKNRLLPTLAAGYTIWPIAHLINFRFIPNAYRLLYINSIQVVWNVALCKIACADNLEAESKVRSS